jgi:hypothetical protein
MDIVARVGYGERGWLLIGAVASGAVLCLAVAACGAGGGTAPGGASPQVTPAAVITAAAASSPVATLSPLPVSPSASPALVPALYRSTWEPCSAGPDTGVTCLRVSVATQRLMRRLYARYRHIRLSYVIGGLPDSVLGATITATGAEWAAVMFEPPAHAPLKVAIGFQDGGGTGIFARAPGGGWQALGGAGEPFGCEGIPPPAIVRLWLHRQPC